MRKVANVNSMLLKLRDGFDRLAAISRADMWRAAATQGLNPTQMQVLFLLARRPKGLRSKDIAHHLGVSGPSITDTLSSLSRKKLIIRYSDPEDARATILCISEKGVQTTRAINAATSHLANALTTLPEDRLADLLTTQIHLIHTLQTSGAIPLQRMCVSCEHFRPNVEPASPKRHFCAFLNAAIADTDLQIDCQDHAQADVKESVSLWSSFAGADRKKISGENHSPDTEVPR